MIEFLLLDHACDVAEVALVSGFPVEVEFVEDDVFGRGDGDFARAGLDAAGMCERPGESWMIA